MKKKRKPWVKRRVTLQGTSDRVVKRAKVTEFLTQMEKVSQIIVELKAKIQLLETWKANLMDKLITCIESRKRDNPDFSQSPKQVKIVAVSQNSNIVIPRRGRPLKIKKAQKSENGSEAPQIVSVTPKPNVEQQNDLHEPEVVRRVSSRVIHSERLRRKMETRKEMTAVEAKKEEKKPEVVVFGSKSPVKYETADSVVTPDTRQGAKKMIDKVTVRMKNGYSKRWKCRLCGKILTMLQNAKLHICRVHFKERLACPKCQAKFYDYKQLRKHRQGCKGVKGPSLQTSPLTTSRRLPPPRLLRLPLDTDRNSRYSFRRPRRHCEQIQGEKLTVRNPFQNFDLKRTLAVTILLERLPPPPDSLESKLEDPEIILEEDPEIKLQKDPVITLQEEMEKEELDAESEMKVDSEEEESLSNYEVSPVDQEAEESFPRPICEDPPHEVPFVPNEDLVIPYGLSSISDTEIGQIFGHDSPVKFKSLGFADIHSSEFPSSPPPENFQYYSESVPSFPFVNNGLHGEGSDLFGQP